MQWFVNMKTRTKLIVGFGVVCAMMAAVGIVGVRQLSQVNASTVDVAERWMPTLAEAANIKANAALHRVRLMRHILTNDPAEMTEIEGELAVLETKLSEGRKHFESLLASEQGKQLWAQYLPLWEKYLAGHRTIVALSREHKAVQAQALVGTTSKEEFYIMSGALDVMITRSDSGAVAAKEEAARTFETARALLLGLVAGAVLISALLALYIAGVISRPLQQTVEVLKGVADGDFTQVLDVNSKDEVGQLASALNRAVSGMRTALTDVRSSAEAVASASLELSAGSEEISSGAQEQASSLEETASSLEEMASTIKQSADNAQQANQLASGAREIAEKGGRVVSEAVKAMAEINQSSNQIADIINTIDEIAFQTNLLALNAAVEAARAGEQGRGFAVVAAEVRNLAKRSATSAKEIKVLIQDSVRKVENGSELVNQSGQTLQEIVTSVKRVTDIVGEIAAATREQSTGIDQVNRAVTQMDSVTQSNAGQTEELASTAESLSSQAEQLQALVAKFRLEADGERRVTKSAVARAPRSTGGNSRKRPGAAQHAFSHAAGGNGRSGSNGNGNPSCTTPRREVLASRFASLDDDADGSGAIFEEL